MSVDIDPKHVGTGGLFFCLGCWTFNAVAWTAWFGDWFGAVAACVAIWYGYRLVGRLMEGKDEDV